MEELLTLRGVARKTANVVLGNCFGINEGVVVDTHVERLSHRLGLSRGKTPQAIERDLMALIPQDDWCLLSHLLIFHGRRVCKARGGGCAEDSICRRYCRDGSKAVRAEEKARAAPAAAERKSPKSASRKVARAGGSRR